MAEIELPEPEDLEEKVAHFRSFFLFSLVAAVLGSFLSLNGFLMFLRIPFFHY